MDRRSLLAAMAVGAGSLSLPRSAAGQTPPIARAASPGEQSAAINAAASAFLQALAPERRARVAFPFPKGQSPTAIGFGAMPKPPGGPGGKRHDVSFDVDGRPMPDDGPAERPPQPPRGAPPPAGEKYGDSVWTNFPVDIVPRPGVRMGDFAPAERDAARALLKAALSPMGCRKLLDIMAADQKVADAGPDYAAGVAVYTLGLFGEPSATAPWMLQFGGHHLGLNVTFVGDKAVCAPLHTGILPARFAANGAMLRGLGRENDKAFDLVATFTPEQLRAALIDHDVSELVFGPGRPDATLSPQGLLGADMTAAQRTTLLSLIGEWVGVLNDAHCSQRLEDIRLSLPETRFAWSGPTTREAGFNGEAYFRVHGPSLLIEHAPQRNQGGYRVHVHTVMRDLHNDYAKNLV